MSQVEQTAVPLLLTNNCRSRELSKLVFYASSPIVLVFNAVYFCSQ